MSEAAPRPTWRRVTGSVWFQLVLAFIVVGLLLTFVAKPYVVPSESMQGTLEPGDRVLVNRLAYVGSEPATGDIVVFDADESWGEHAAGDGNWFKSAARWIGEVTGFGPSGAHTLVKRVIAGPGQTVECCSAEGELMIHGEPLDEPYIFNDPAFVPGRLDCSTTPISDRCFAAVTVPEDSYLVLGDNRGNSSDSAIGCRRLETGDDGCWRWMKREDVVGKVGLILWPVGRWAVP
ncbi:signal peptidase I [Microbacterium sp.]|uniref:signal peptidase I n=1 Tax=Microbacterium sp. TaxID=51671 RepID=UPI002FE0F2DD